MDSNFKMIVILFLLAIPPLILIALTRKKSSVILIQISMALLWAPLVVGAITEAFRVIFMFDEDKILLSILFASPLLVLVSLGLSAAAYIYKSSHSKKLAMASICTSSVYAGLLWYFMSNMKYHA